MSNYEIFTLLVAAYGALLATYTLVAQLREKRRRLKVSLSPGFVAYSGGSVSGNMIILEGANVGHIDITLSGHAILLPDKSQLVFPKPGAEHQFPHTLTPGRGCTLWFPAKEIAEALRAKGFHGAVNIRGSLKDQTGARYKSKAMKFNVRDWLAS